MSRNQISEDQEKLIQETLDYFGGSKEERKVFDQKRLEANRKLVQELSWLIENNTHERFSQILQNYGFIKPGRPHKDPAFIYWQNEFYLEPQDLLERVYRRVKDISEQRINTPQTGSSGSGSDSGTP